jgi:ribosomal protein L21E
MPTRAHERAKTLDGGIEQSLSGLELPSVRDLVAQIRTYLLRQDADLQHRNNVHRILRTIESQHRTVITVGPSIDKGSTEPHFHLESGSRLSFGITLRETNGRCSLVAYRFHLSLPEGQSPSFYRFDLNDKAHESPLTEPRCHYHPGVDDVRLPCPVLTPLEVFDRIFMVIEPRL